jgi:transcriptional regulator with XRE-family HTH domain
VPKEFKDLLVAHLKRLGLSQNRFAPLAGTAASIVSRVAKGTKSPPEGMADAWADALSLKGDERSEFTVAFVAAKATAQTRAAPHIDKLEADLLDMKRRLKTALSIADVLLARLGSQGKKLPHQTLKELEALKESL